MSVEALFATFPVRETERFVLREIRESDAEELFGYFSRDEVTEYYNREPFASVDEAYAVIARHAEGFREQVRIRWGIARKADDVLIGTCGFHHWEKEHFRAEVGYDVAPEYWGKGVMTEALASLVEFGFERMGLERIEALLATENVGSARVVEKNGFRREGVMRKYLFKNGRFYDAAMYAILKDEFVIGEE
ncbi:MAG: GNAT family N-acetyltransferase [Tumebacillaceae bacterium]